MNPRLRRRPRPPLQLAAIAVAATWTAGFVDLVGFYLLAHILTANMSGNSVRFASGIASGNGSEILRRGWPVAFFTVGLLASALVHEVGTRHRFLRTSAIVFGLEAALLMTVQMLYTKAGPAFGDGPRYFLAAGLLAVAMGLQNATLTRVGALSVRTTHITGTISEFAEGFSHFCFWSFDRLRAAGANRIRRVLALAVRRHDFQQAVVTVCLWTAFVLGALSGTLTMRYSASYLLLPPVAALIVFLVFDLIRPLAASAEHEVKRSGARTL